MKILKIVLVSIFLLVLLDWIIGSLLDKYYFLAKSGNIAKITYVVDSTNADLIFVGASTTSHNYNPELFSEKTGLTCFNAGRDGTGMLYYNALIKMVLSRYKPKIILLDVHFISLNSTYNDEDRIAPLLPYCNEHKEVLPIITSRNKFEKIKLMSRIYPFNSQVWDIIRFQQRKDGDDFRELKGFIPLNGNIDGKKPSKQLDLMEVDTTKINLLVDIMHMAKSSGVRLIVVLPPEYYPVYIYPENYLKSLCEENNIEVIDFLNNSAFLNSPYLFHDYSHLNKEGADILTIEVSKQLY